MDPIDFYKRLRKTVTENKIINLTASVADNRVILKNSPFNYTSASNLFMLIMGTLIGLQDSTLFVLGIIIFLIGLFNLISDLVAVNTLKIDSLSNKIYLSDLGIFNAKEIDLKTALKFNITESSQGFIYKRYRINVLLKTGENITLVDVATKDQANILLNEFNRLMKCN